jgi:nucleoside 2-deoxyribosyltransferase
MRVYLAGHMPKPGENDWRNDIIHRLCNYDIDFLVPMTTANTTLEKVKHDLTATKDEMYLNQCDVAVVNLDLKLGKCLGAMWEFGYLYSRHIPIILYNHHNDMGRTEFLKHKASATVTTFNELIEALIYMSLEWE